MPSSSPSGAAEHINDDIKSFMERYSDMMYLAPQRLSIIGSIFAGIYTKITRIAPEKASELAIAILDIAADEYARASTPSTSCRTSSKRPPPRRDRLGTHHLDRRLDTFKLGYEFVRDEIGMRRDHLKRHPRRRTTKVVNVKTAQSAKQSVYERSMPSTDPGVATGSREENGQIKATPPRFGLWHTAALISAILRLSALRGSATRCPRLRDRAGQIGQASTPSRWFARPSMIAFQSARPCR